MRAIIPRLPRSLVYGPWNPWGIQRELPPMPQQSFRDLYEKGTFMSSRNAILDSLRQNVPPPASRPAPINGIRYADPIKQFEETLTVAGGTLVRPTNPQDLAGELAKIDVYANAAKIGIARGRHPVERCRLERDRGSARP